MDITIPTKTRLIMRLRGRPLLELGPNNNTTPYSVARKSGISANTIYRLLSKRAKDLQLLDLNNFPSVMITGLGLSKEEFMALKLSDIFTLEEDCPSKKEV